LKRESEVERHESITHQTGRRLDFLIIGVMAVAIVLLLTDRFVLRHGVNQEIDVAISEKSIAVLPFVDMSQAKDQEYFSDGISEELLNLLAKVTQLHVAARTSSFSFKGKDVPIPEIAKTLHVAHVLEGSIRKSGDEVRITAQLIRAADGYHVWSETWDRKLDDIFKVQDEIAGKVVDELKVTLLGAAPSVRTTDPKAYALFLQSKQLGLQSTAEGFAKSDELLRQVLAIDPRYAPAWDDLARNYINEAGRGLLASQEGFARAREAAEKALAIDPEYGPAYARLGFIAMTFDSDLAGAAKHFQRALMLAPTDVDVLRNAALYVGFLGRLDEALAIHESIVRRDPVSPSALFNLANAQRNLGRYDEAVACYRTVLSLVPGRSKAHAGLGEALVLHGDPVGALTEIEQERVESWRMITLPIAYHALGREADSDAALAALVVKYGREDPFNIAYVYAFRGEADKAFEWLNNTITYEDPGIAEIVTENLFANIRSDPRWLPFLRKIGRAPEQLAKIEFKVTLPKEWQAEAQADASKSASASN
jgi:TolB-like protein/Tfp pilus assembly protein PilF